MFSRLDALADRMIAWRRRRRLHRFLAEQQDGHWPLLYGTDDAAQPGDASALPTRWPLRWWIGAFICSLAATVSLAWRAPRPQVEARGPNVSVTAEAQQETT